MSASSAIPNSTINGIPKVALTARKKRVLSMDKNPTTWEIALRRVIIMSNESKKAASAIPSIPGAAAGISPSKGRAATKEKSTSKIPSNWVLGTLTTISTSPLTRRRRSKRCNTPGMMNTLIRRVIAADIHRVPSPVKRATRTVLRARVTPCQANRRIRLSSRRWASSEKLKTSIQAARNFSRDPVSWEGSTEKSIVRHRA